MSLFFFLYFSKIIAAKWEIVTSVSPTLEAINDSYVYVDYSKAFDVDFSEIETAELKSFQFLRSKASMYTTQIKIVGNTIHQPLKENRKILAKLKICTTYPHRTDLGRNMNLQKGK